MKVQQAIFIFKGWKFTWIPVKKKRLEKGGRFYIEWEIIIEWRNKKYKGGYMAFTPSASICRHLKRSKRFIEIRNQTSK